MPHFRGFPPFHKPRGAPGRAPVLVTLLALLLVCPLDAQARQAEGASLLAVAAAVGVEQGPGGRGLVGFAVEDRGWNGSVPFASIRRRVGCSIECGALTEYSAFVGALLPVETTGSLSPFLRGGLGGFSTHGRTPDTQQDRTLHVAAVLGLGVEWRMTGWVRPRVEMSTEFDGSPGRRLTTLQVGTAIVR